MEGGNAVKRIIFLALALVLVASCDEGQARKEWKGRTREHWREKEEAQAFGHRRHQPKQVFGRPGEKTSKQLQDEESRADKEFRKWSEPESKEQPKQPQQQQPHQQQ